MTTATMNRILRIFHEVETQEEYKTIWGEYEISHERLLEFMETLPDAQCRIIDNFAEAFFDVHLQMMDKALNEAI